MAQTTMSTQPRTSLLHRALLANGIFSSISGLVFMIFSAPIAAFLGVDFSGVLIALGLVLILFGLGVVWLATRTEVPRSLTIVVTILDLAWVLGSILLLVSELIPLTSEGKWAIAIIADIVAVFAILQIIGLRRLPETTN